MTAEDNNKRIAINTLFLYVRMAVVLIVALYTSRIILQSLGVTDYGIYNVVGGIITVMSFLNGALTAGTNRFLTYELGKGNIPRLKETFSSALNLHIGVATLAVIIGETLGLWLFHEKLVIPLDRIGAAMWVYQLSILNVIFVFTQVPYNSSIISHENMKVYAYVGLYEAISKLIIALLIKVSPIDKLVFYALLLCINSIGIQVFYRFYTYNRYEECRFRIVKNKSIYKKLLSYSGWDMFGNLAIVCQGQGINILLNIFFGPVVNAARAISIQMQGALNQFVSNFLMAVRPQVIKNFAQDKPQEMYNLTFYAAKFSYMLMFLLMIPIIFEIDFVLRLWLGENVPEQTNIFAIIILITALMQTFHSASLMPYHAIGRIKTGNIIGGSLMIAALPISYIVLKLGGPAHSVFMVIFVVNFAQMFITWYLIHKYSFFSCKELIKRVYLPCGIVSMIGFLFPITMVYMMTDGWLRFTVLLIGSLLINLCVIWYVGLTIPEREKIQNIIKQRITL